MDLRPKDALYGVGGVDGARSAGERLSGDVELAARRVYHLQTLAGKLQPSPYGSQRVLRQRFVERIAEVDCALGHIDVEGAPMLR